MKVILLQDVAKIGRRHEVVEVPHGFAQNKLIPQRLAEEATPENLKRQQARAAKIATERASADAAFKEALAALAGTKVTIAVEANETGHMFQALKHDAIAAALNEQGIALTKEQIRIDAPIKQIGEHEVAAVSGDTEETFTVVVVAK